MRDRVSWLMAVKDGMPYLQETLASIGAQTYRDSEILVWDNGSTDGTLDELRRWIPSRLPGRIIDDNPLSLGNSLARLVELAQTELCARIDADDINYPDRLERQVKFLRERREVILVGTDIEFIDENGRLVPNAWKYEHLDADIRWHLRWGNTIGHPTVLFRRSAVLIAGNYRDCMPYEDYDLWLRMAMKGEISNLPVVLVKYRLRDSSVGAKSSQKCPKSGRRVYDAVFDEMAVRNAEILFSGVSATDALDLRDKVNSRSPRKLKVRPIDVIKFRKAATASAVAVNKPRSYFRSTRLYRAQQRFLLLKIIKQNAAGRACLPVIRKIQSLVRNRVTSKVKTGADRRPLSKQLLSLWTFVCM
jgi:glycosyltransferase involved in cell wall biosynthesis